MPNDAKWIKMMMVIKDRKNSINQMRSIRKRRDSNPAAIRNSVAKRNQMWINRMMPARIRKNWLRKSRKERKNHIEIKTNEFMWLAIEYEIKSNKKNYPMIYHCGSMVVAHLQNFTQFWVIFHKLKKNKNPPHTRPGKLYVVWMENFAVELFFFILFTESWVCPMKTCANKI